MYIPECYYSGIQSFVLDNSWVLVPECLEISKQIEGNARYWRGIQRDGRIGVRCMKGGTGVEMNGTTWCYSRVLTVWAESLSVRL